MCATLQALIMQLQMLSVGFPQTEPPHQLHLQLEPRPDVQLHQTLGDGESAYDLIADKCIPK